MSKIAPPTTASEARELQVKALEADLIGPMTRDPNGVETLLLPPSRWYMTGFLAPAGGRTVESDRTADGEDFAAGEYGDLEDRDELLLGDDVDDNENEPAEPATKRKAFFPASMGISVLLPPAEAGAENDDFITVKLDYADYTAVAAEPKTLDELAVQSGKLPRDRPNWLRVPRNPPGIKIPLNAAALEKGVEVYGSAGVEIEGRIAPTSGPGLPKGTRALSLFVVNRREPEEKLRADLAFIFQAKLRIRYDRGFVARPNLTGEGAQHFDDQVADLQYRHQMEYAVGHGVAVTWNLADNQPESPSEDGAEAHNPLIRVVETTWLPRSEVKRVVTREVEGVLTDMEGLAKLGAATTTAEDVENALGRLPLAYGEWIEGQAAIDVGDGDIDAGSNEPASTGPAAKEKTRDELLRRAQVAKERIQDGISLLASSAEAREAFALANEAMALQALKRSPERYQGESRPKWRLFQLAFVLLNLRGLTDPHHDDRKNVELIFFPTGGGKTEAYLGCIAYTLILRRMRGQERPDQGLGVAVLLRYTLRLLTLDQLERAATLVFALEKLRRSRPQRLGATRFSIGLWVGRSATANTLANVARQLDDFAADRGKSPFPLATCPWCKSPIGPKAMEMKPGKTNADRVEVACLNYRDCEFSRRQSGQSLPILFVDEEIYRELPCFVVSTVDKFALIPWRGEVGKLFGRVNKRFDPRGGLSTFFNSADKGAGGAKKGVPKIAETLPNGLLPPELIVQDELHLISGPLGTMVGLYETAIESLCTAELDGKKVGPKIISSTATVKRAQEQIQALFGRSAHTVFPPPAVDVSETFFAQVDHESDGRVYVGVAAAGRPLKGILLRTYVPLLGAAQKYFDFDGDEGQPVDPYMTLAGYFNSLRELGGMRRLVDDEVRTRLRHVHKRRPRDMLERETWLRGREIKSVVELTSREGTGAISEAKDRLGYPATRKGSVDVVLASNMISVGVDIDRLGMMVVAGQPKSTNEYIQATSRVGRDVNRPGLVVTVFHLGRPRDRSHYERFEAYHQAFYRFVEATSVTPFSGPALERGLAGLLVGLVRHKNEEMTPSSGAAALASHRAYADEIAKELATRAAAQRRVDGADDEERVYEHIRKRAMALLDTWERVVRIRDEKDSSDSCYSPWDPGRKGKTLLYLPTEEETERDADEQQFAAPTSMRDVEASVHLWVDRRGVSSGGTS